MQFCLHFRPLQGNWRNVHVLHLFQLFFTTTAVLTADYLFFFHKFINLTSPLAWAMNLHKMNLTNAS